MIETARREVQALSAFGAVMALLEEIVRPRRERVRELGGPASILRGLDRPGLAEMLEESGPCTWVCEVGFDAFEFVVGEEQAC